MALIRGCLFPDDLLYDVESNVWIKQDGENIVIGMTCYAGALSGQVVSFTPKKTGKEVKKGKSCATVESDKWVGPVKSPVNGVVCATNDLLDTNPALLNDDPYDQGWVVKIKPDNWNVDNQDLLSGEQAMEMFEIKMEAEGFAGC